MEIRPQVLEVLSVKHLNYQKSGMSSAISKKRLWTWCLSNNVVTSNGSPIEIAHLRDVPIVGG